MKHAFRSTALGLSLALGLAGTFTAPPAAAQWAVFDPTNYVQNYLQQLRAVQSNLNEVRQIQQQLDQLKYMAENTKALAQGDWEVGIDSIGRLTSVLENGQALAVSGKNFESQFKGLFPGYKPDRNYTQSFDQWNATTRDSVFGAMRVANMQMNGITSEQQAMDRLRMAARSSTGQKQALDAANQIALSQVAQLQQLRELMIAQTQAAGTQAAAAAQEAATKKGLERDALKYNNPRQGYSPKASCAVPPCK